MSDVNSAMEVILDLLRENRAKGILLQIRGIESVISKLGIALGSEDHLILLLADFEEQLASGISITVDDLVRDYPNWDDRIRNHFNFMGFVSRIRRDKTTDLPPEE